MIINIVIIALLLIIIIIQILSGNKSEAEKIAGFIARLADDTEELLRSYSDGIRDNVSKQISAGATEQFARFGMIQEGVQSTLQKSRGETNATLQESRNEINKTLQDSREETNKILQESRNEINKTLLASRDETNKTLQASRDETNKTLQASRDETNKTLQASRVEINRNLQENRSETNKTLRDIRAETNKQLGELRDGLDARLNAVLRANAENAEKINLTLENKINQLQESNEKRLEKIQDTVDEKLQKTLETRLTKSFELVVKQLDSVQQGLGEMKNLAADAKSLKNALINVKERGTYGEVRLERLLADILAPGQYEMNAEIAAGKRVEFVIKLPGNGDTPLLLPIDSKFPIEDYNRLLDAEDKQSIDEARKSLIRTIRESAKTISEKYIAPPITTDFALMFLPTEGLYAEVVQNAALFEELRDKYKVTAVGATTLSAFLSSLQMGFKTLAIEQRSQEVWDTLRAVKKQFGEFEKILDTAHKQIQRADNTIEQIVGVRTKQINKALRGVEELTDDNKQLSLPEPDDYDDEEPF